VPYDEYDVDEWNGGYNPHEENDYEQDAMTMLAIFVTLAQLSVSETAGSSAIRRL
jgi:hypothetical protein